MSHYDEWSRALPDRVHGYQPEWCAARRLLPSLPREPMPSSSSVSFQCADPSSGASGIWFCPSPAQPAELGHSHGPVNATSSSGQGFTWLCTRQQFHAEFD
jgi:hypothetical protein